MRDIILSAEDISKSFKEGKKHTFILEHLNIELYQADFTVIMGSSGAGKSTLLYALSGMEPVTQGRITYKNNEITKIKEKQMAKLRAEEFGFIFQQTHLVSNLTLYENVVIAGYLDKRQDEKNVVNRTKQLFEQMDIVGAMNRLPAFVSGGESQRAAIARAMICNPGILFADEPTGALNRKNTDIVMDILTELNNTGQNILMVTHDIHTAIRGNRILYMEDGKILGEYQFPKYKLHDSKKREENLSKWLTAMHW